MKAEKVNDTGADKKQSLISNMRENPNADTLAAIKETQEMLMHPEHYKAYDDVDAMMQDILVEK